MAMVQLAPQPHSQTWTASQQSRRNGAAVFSLVCVVLWPLSWLVPALFNVVTGGPRLPGPTLPEPLITFFQFGFAILPILGIIAGSIGLYRSLKQPALRGTVWQALVGLALSCMWVAGIFVLSFAGLDLLHWLSHLLG